MTDREAPAGRQRAKQLEALLSAAELLNAAADPDAVLRQLVEAGARFFPARLVAAFTREGERAVCQHWHSRDEGLRGPFEAPLDGSACGRAFEQGEPAWGAGAAGEPPLVGPHCPGYRPAAALAVPVVARSGSVSAVLGLFDLSPFDLSNQRTPGDEALWLARGIARHAAISLERAALSAELTRTTRALALLEERARVAMDLHDGAIQSLYGVMLGLGAQARTLDPTMVEARASLERAVDQLTIVIQDIRKYITGLYTQELGARGLPAGLEALASDLRINAHLDASLELEVELEDLLQPEAIAHVLQFAREATSNVIRHADARSVSIGLRYSDGGLTLSIADDGRGFDPDAARMGRGQGLRTMAERAHRLGGAMAIRSAAGQGTEVRLEIPLTAELKERS